jgi:hypothetical protein
MKIEYFGCASRSVDDPPDLFKNCEDVPSFHILQGGQLIMRGDCGFFCGDAPLWGFARRTRLGLSLKRILPKVRQ